MKMMVALMLLMIMILATSFRVARSDPNTSINTLACSTVAYGSDDPYGDNVAYVLADLMNVAPSKQGYNYYTRSPGSTSICYGHATCNPSLANSECANCLVAAKAAVSGACSGFIGGHVEMVDCGMRYENYAFA